MLNARCDVPLLCHKITGTKWSIHSLFTVCFGEAVILNPKLTASNDFESKHHSCVMLNSHWLKLTATLNPNTTHVECLTLIGQHLMFEIYKF